MVLRDSEQCILHEPQIRALARIKLPYSRGAKRVKMVLKKPAETHTSWGTHVY